MVEWTNLKETVARAYDSKNCPNCGAPIENEKCPYCGSVFVDFACMDAEKPFYVKIKQGESVYILKVRLNTVNITSEDATLFTDRFEYLRYTCNRELDMNFTIL